MSKIAILGDLHIGFKGGNESFLEFQTEWLKKFLQKCKDEGVTNIIQTGDFFDIRKTTPNNIIHWVINVFNPMVIESGIPWDIIVGNHDIFFKHSNEMYTSQILTAINPTLINVYNRPLTKNICGIDFYLCPWLDKANSESLDKDLTSTKALYGVGHLELAMFPMYQGNLAEHGLDASKFKQFKTFFSGHYHTISESQNIVYVGSPYHLTWMDCVDGVNRGWFLFDCSNGSYKLMKNEEYETLFSFVEYDEDHTYTKEDLLPYQGTIMKILVVKKDNKTKFLKFKEILNNLDLISYSVIDKTDKPKDDLPVSSEIDKKERTTIESIREYVDDVDLPENILKENMKVMLENYYKLALEAE